MKNNPPFNIVMVIILIISFQPMISSNELKEDVLDQSQTDFTHIKGKVNINQQWAQSFVPTVAMISMVKLFMNNYDSNNDFTISIRKDLDDTDLTNVKKSASSLQNEILEWIEFDFPDISVEPGETYYIVCNHMSESSIQWGASDNDLYESGKAYSQQLNPLGLWEPWEDDMPFPYSVDFCFQTYGKFHPPEQPSEPKGPNQLHINQIGQYITNTNDLDGDKIRYGWDWNDDDIVDFWSEYYEPREFCIVNNSWPEKGNYHIKVLAEDIDGYQSKWSYSKSLAVPFCKKGKNYFQFDLLIHYFYNLFQNLKIIHFFNNCP